jgi:hypothetical protein
MTDSANEADVREEIAAPLLTEMGYKRGTSNDIAREFPLAYERQFLGRKKSTDPALRGRADYIMTVAGAGRWVLETKPAGTPIDKECIDQALSYARHPEVAASYAVIANGETLEIFGANRSSLAAPLAKFRITDVHSLAKQVANILSPAAIRRDCSPPVVDLGQPIANGLRSRVVILRGEIWHESYTSSLNVPMPAPAIAQLDESLKRLHGLHIAITGGEIWRDETSRIRAKLRWAYPHVAMQQFALDKQLMDVEYVSLDDAISSSPATPTVFDVVGGVSLTQGESIFDIAHWRTEFVGTDMSIAFAGQATGFISEGLFSGAISTRHICTLPRAPEFCLAITMCGTISIEVDRR